jgi:two-component system, NtrC family, sensor kinase
VHILDLRTDASYVEHEPIATVGAERGQVRTIVAVPMLKDRDVVGIFAILRQEVRRFTDKQIELVQNCKIGCTLARNSFSSRVFSIAMTACAAKNHCSNRRRPRKSLTSSGNSPTDSQPAFNAIVRSGLRLFPDAAIMIGLLDGDVIRAAAIADADPAGAEALRARTPIPLSREFITSTAILDRREIDLADVREAPAELAAGAKNFLASGCRAQTVVPMMR